MFQYVPPILPRKGQQENERIIGVLRLQSGYVAIDPQIRKTETLIHPPIDLGEDHQEDHSNHLQFPRIQQPHYYQLIDVHP